MRKKITIIIISAMAIILVLLAVPVVAYGQIYLSNTANLEAFRITAGYPDTNLIPAIARMVRIFLALIAIVVVLLIILGGLRWMVAGDSEEKRMKARKVITSAIVGLVIIFIAYAITAFVMKLIITATI